MSERGKGRGRGEERVALFSPQVAPSFAYTWPSMIQCHPLRAVSSHAYVKDQLIIY